MITYIRVQKHDSRYDFLLHHSVRWKDDVEDEHYQTSYPVSQVAHVAQANGWFKVTLRIGGRIDDLIGERRGPG